MPEKKPTTNGIIRLAAELAPVKGEDKERIANLTWYSGATVKRLSWDGFYNLTFSMDPAHVRMERLASGKAPLLNAHRDWDLKDIIGVIESADLKGQARIRFSNREDVTPIWNDVQDGIIRNASMGAAIHKLQDVSKENDKTKSYLATDWEPLEVSLLPIGADPNAGLAVDGKDNLEQLRANAQKEDTMPEAINAGASAGAVNDADQIRQVGLAAHLPKDFVEGAIGAGVTLENARTLFINEAARRSQEQPPTFSHHAELVSDSGDTQRLAMQEALFARMSGKAPAEIGRDYMGVRLSDMARDLMLSRGLRVPRNPGEVVRMALSHTTSDFPLLLQGTGQRVLLNAYQAAQPAIKTVCRQTTVQDFRAKYALRLGEAPALIKVPESGELTHGTRGEVAESYRAYTYGRLFSLTREAIINDDLGAFNDFVSAFGQSAAGLEAQILVILLAANAGAGPTMSDGKALFHTDHSNLAGSGAAISDTTLPAARLALRTATGLDGSTIISAAPRYLLVPAALETTAEKYLATLYPAEAANVNPFSGKLELLVEPRLDSGVDVYRWYVFADPAVAPCLEYAYLEGQPGPRVETRQGWETLGVEFRAYEDFGAGAIGYRGAYSNAGH